MANYNIIVEQRKQAILYQLDKCKCEGECPLRKSCNLNLSIYDKSLCDVLRNEKEEA